MSIQQERAQADADGGSDGTVGGYSDAARHESDGHTDKQDAADQGEIPMGSQVAKSRASHAIEPLRGEQQYKQLRQSGVAVSIQIHDPGCCNSDDGYAQICNTAATIRNPRLRSATLPRSGVGTELFSTVNVTTTSLHFGYGCVASRIPPPSALYRVAIFWSRISSRPITLC